MNIRNLNLFLEMLLWLKYKDIFLEKIFYKGFWGFFDHENFYLLSKPGHCITHY